MKKLQCRNRVNWICSSFNMQLLTLGFRTFMVFTYKFFDFSDLHTSDDK